MSVPLTGQELIRATRAVTLRDVLDSASRASPTVAAAQARARAARGARTTAGVFANPTLALQVENAPLPGRDAPPMERETMTTAMIPLEPLYQRGARVRRANAEVNAAASDALSQQRHIMLSAARGFYRAALAQVGHATALDLAAWLDTLVAYNRARTEEGVAAEADLIRSELERDNALAEAAMQEAELARARAELATYLGDRVDGRQLMVVIDDGPMALPSIDERPVGHIDTRPDVRAARDRTAAAGAGVSSERTMFIRHLGAMVGTKRSAGFTSLVAGFSVPLPIFDQNRGETARAAAERDAARFDLAAVERVARAELVGAEDAARLLTDRTAGLSGGAATFLSRAGEARRIALGAWREGAVPLMQVLDAARAWRESRITYHRLLFAQHESVLELLVAQGRDPSIMSAAGIGAANR